MKKILSRPLAFVLILSILFSLISVGASDTGTAADAEINPLEIFPLSQPMHGRTEIAEKPVSGHPRLLFREADIPVIKENLNHSQNVNLKAEFEEYANAEAPSGVLEESDSFNYDPSSDTHLNIYEAKAFNYIINGNETHGREAFDGIVSLMQTINYDLLNNRGINYHDVSNILMIAAEIYDWCYPLLDDTDKTSFLQAGQRLMGYFEWGRQNSLFWNEDTQLSYPLNLETTSMVSGGGSSTLLLVDVFSFAVAIYDDTDSDNTLFNSLYDYVSAVIKQRNMPGRNYWYASGRYMSGSSYGVLRAFSDSWLYRITDTALDTSFHEDSFKELGYYILYEYMPDGKYLREGDDNWHAFTQYTSNDYDSTSRYAILQLLAAETGNGYYKAMAEIISPDYSLTNYGYCPFTAVQQLIINDPSLEARDLNELSATRYFGEPDGTMIAKTGWETGRTSPAAAAFMKIGGNVLYDHNHNDSGSFQIYYKGILMQDMGIYALTSKGQYYAYNTSTVSHNSLLIYDPLEYYYPRSVLLKNSETDEYYDVNAGGQRYTDVAMVGHKDYEQYSKKQNDRADVTAHGFGPDAVSPEYSYISGDITNAYSEKAKAAQRSMMFMETGIEGAPAVFMVMDKITSDKAYMDKKFLFQCIEEPQINGNAITVSRGTLSGDKYAGEITSQILSPKNYKIEPIGGAGSQWLLNGINYTPYGYSNASTRLDFGWGRIEISSQEENETEYFLNAMYVNDAGKFGGGDTLEIQTAELIEDGNFIGAGVLNKITLFSKKEDKFSKDITVSITGADDTEYDIALTGFESGLWEIYDENGLITATDVSEEAGIVYFSGVPGQYTVKALDVSENEMISDSSFGGGDGTKRNPYEIYTAEHFFNIASHPDSYFILKDNIDLSGYNYTPFELSGELNGNGRSVTLSLSHPETDSIGLFSVLNKGAKIYDLRVYGTVEGREKVGGIVGDNYGSVKDCENYADITSNYRYGGGIAGHSQTITDTIRGCINYGSVICRGSSSSQGAGGIVGYCQSPVILCANYGDISSGIGVGGIVGLSYGDIYASFNTAAVTANNEATGSAGGIAGTAAGNHIYRECFNTGAVTGAADKTGGIIGYKASAKNKLLSCYNIGGTFNTDGTAAGEESEIYGGYAADRPFALIDNCYYLSESGASSIDGITALTASEFLSADSFDFDFENIWTVKAEGYGYPQLKGLSYTDSSYNPDNISVPEAFDMPDTDINLSSLAMLSENELFTLLNKYVLLSYARVSAGNSEYTLVDCGTVFSASDSSPEIGQNGCIAKSAYTGSDTFGILFYGALDKDYDYYLRSYAAYVYKGNTYIVYGDVITAQPKPAAF